MSFNYNLSSSQKNLLVRLLIGITLLVVSYQEKKKKCWYFTFLISFFLEISEPSISPVTSTIPPTSAPKQQKEKKKKKKDPSKGRWVEGITSEGYHYYYDLITGGRSGIELVRMITDCLFCFS